MRGLMAAVIGMGVLILVGVPVMVVVVIKQSRTASAGASAPVTLQEPAGSKLLSASSDGKTLTLVLGTPSGEQIEVRDAASGQIEQRFNLAF
jgi:hypothetical protein